jgi:DmsE family decaheme c-type cytochrome
MECSTCHDPHARAGKDNIRETRSGEVICLSCHADKRGPFAYEHGARVQGDCTTCHEPHGSNYAKQLKRSNVLQLCSECHSPTGATYGSQPPSFHNTGYARYQNCTTCHTAIHGSNRSPALLK